MKYLPALVAILISASCNGQTFTSSQIPAASITFACDCEEGDSSQRSISKQNGEPLVIDCGAGQKLVQTSICPGTHLFSGAPLISERGAMYYRVVHGNGRESESGYVYYGQRREPFYLEVEPGDKVVFELKKINSRP